MHSAIEYGLKKGAEYVEVKSAQAKRVSIEVQDCAVKEFASSDILSFGVRVFASGGEGIVFSTKENYLTFVEEFFDLARFTLCHGSTQQSFWIRFH